MADPNPLLVPIEVHALVFDNAAQPFRRWEMNYDAQDYFLSPSAVPFASGQNDFTGTDGDPDNQGVYLHWTLPDALRHGSADEQYGPITYPLVPNRWLVVRFSTAPSRPDVREATAWMVESDYMDAATGSTAFLDVTATPSAVPDVYSRRYPATRIGRAVAQDGWAEPGGTAYLTAVGPSNPLFAAYQPHCQNVFSFHDPLRTDDHQRDALSYLVVGWYSTTADGPLAAGLAEAGATFEDVLAALQWTTDAPGTTAASAIYSGTVLGVAWDPDAQRPPAQPLAGAAPSVAVGNTSMDALAQLVEAYTGPGTAHPEIALDDEALHAFLYNLYNELDLPNGDLLIDRQIHDAWFQPSSGGTYWSLVQQEAEIGEAPPPQPTAAQLSLLDQLNQAQHTLDQAGRDLLDLQRRLYEMWWKNGFAQGYAPLFTDPYGAPLASLEAQLDPATSGGLVAQVYAQLTDVADDQAVVQALLTQYQAALDADPTLPRLKPIARPSFFTPNDPVVLLAGANQPYRLAPNALLRCRFPDDCVTAVVLSDDGGQTLTASQIEPLVPGLTTTANLPALVSEVLDALMTEAFLTDPANAGSIAVNVYGDSGATDAIAESLAALGDDDASLVTGTLPTFWEPTWTQPWRPLFLEWEVAWYPVPFADGRGPLWTYDGREYRWTTPLDETPEPTVFSGRSILTPKSTFDLKARLAQYLRDYPDGGGPLGDVPTMSLDDLEAAVDIIDGWDLLSQSLGGFNAQVALRAEATGPTPDDATPVYPADALTMADLVGDGLHHTPLSRLIKPPPGLDASPPPAFTGFEAMRCGQFFFRYLRLVDRFGQVADFVTPETSGVLAPVAAEDFWPDQTVTSVEPYRFVQLPPRLLQAARFDFDLVAAADQSQRSFLHSTSDPVCGWLLPNHLDEGLSVYAPDGTSLGELGLMTQASGPASVTWRSAPDAPAVSTINAHLDGFVDGLLAQSAEAFTAFLGTVDETLWTIDPLGARQDSMLSVLMGRPLALVRARLQFELQQAPLDDPAWPWTFSPQPTAFPDYAFPVRLGDQRYHEDGLLGYFLGPDGGTDYATFFAVHDAAEGAQAFIEEIGSANYPTLRFDGTTEVFMTLLVDPRAAVYAYSALLPVKTLTLPQGYVDGPLSTMNVTFRSGPFLTRLVTAEDPESGPTQTILMPPPAERHGTWGWQERTVDSSDGPPTQAWNDPIPLTPTDDQAHLSSALPSLREGLLLLRDALEPND